MSTRVKELTHAQAMRYSRHVMLPKLDFEGQESIIAAKVLVIGAGGLGCACLPYLVSSGVGAITIADDDCVELHNLQRQILYCEDDVGNYKANAAKACLEAMNSEVAIDAVCRRVDEHWLTSHLAEYDIVIDCCDNLETRNTINRACVAHQIMLISGAAIRFEGQVIALPMGPGMPCYACISRQFGEQQLSCMEAGVFAPLVGTVGTLQATLALKWLARRELSEAGTLFLYDALDLSWHRIKVHPYEDCSVCSGDR